LECVQSARKHLFVVALYFRTLFPLNRYASKKKAFTKYANDDKFSAKFEEGLEYIAANADTVRVVAHTQPSLLGLRVKTAQVFEIQINGGSIADKVSHAKALLEQQVCVDAVFQEGEYIDILGATKGHGYEGVITRWGVKRLPRKTHRGLRKVACIGAWHPARVGYQVARAGQRGYHHRTERNKRVYRLGKKVASGEVDITASTASDLTQKGINPMGGFPHYGVVRNDWLMLHGGIIGTKKRPLTLRKAIRGPATFSGDLNLLFIDTSSKYGHGRFQTDAEKRKYLGTLKKDKEE
jgi:large subunit ribosomal protein L3e